MDTNRDKVIESYESIERFKFVWCFYQYLFTKKPIDLIIFLLLTFLLPFVPYIWVAIELCLAQEADEHLRAFYGDGSMISLCAGILCAYFAILFDYENQEQGGNNNQEQKRFNALINIGLIFLFLIFLFVFKHCQLTFYRSWSFIYQILAISGVGLIITFGAATYLNFNKKVDYAELKKFIDERQSRKTAIRANKTTKTQDGVQL